MDSKKITQGILGILAFVALTTGAMETILGIPVQRFFGAHLPAEVLCEPVFMSQFRFTSFMWFTYGILLVIFLRDLKRYAVTIKVSFWAVLIAGLIRIPTFIQCGIPTDDFGRFYILTMLVCEVTGAVAGLLIFRSAEKTGL